MVHHAADKCAFIKANCPDEEAGIFSYLDLYYCRLPYAKPVAFAILVLWLGLLFSTIGIAASDFFCPNLSTIANLLGMSESMAGVTFLAFGNGSPDVFSTFAAMSTNSASLAIGELVGAASFITAVVAGSMALVRPFKVARKSFVRDVGFFIVAAAFSMVFLFDGKLSLWESATMVGFYIFYVCFVVVWHWWMGRRKARRRRAASMRSHYVTPGGDEEELFQEYHDEDDGPVTEGGQTPAMNISVDDFAALERAGGEESLEEDDNEDERERWLGELSSNMRLSRPPLGSRRNTHTPIRPSLVGALEFRSVLSSLQKSRNIHSMPISLRRYSDDPNFTAAQQQHLTAGSVDIPQDLGSDDTLGLLRPSDQRRSGSRARAVSTNDMDNTRHDPEILFARGIPSIDFDMASPEDERERQNIAHVPPSPTISLSPPPSEHASRSVSPGPSVIHRPEGDRLAPPGLDSQGLYTPHCGSAGPSPLTVPVPDSPSRRRSRPQPTLQIPGPASPPRPFPSFYTDDPDSAHVRRPSSLRLPSPSISPASYFPDHSLLETTDSPRPPRWWPCAYLPSPGILLGTMFPTLDHWPNKNVWEKLLGAVAAPSVFLLTATLPVVETHKDDDDSDAVLLSPSISLPPPLTPGSKNSLQSHASPRNGLSVQTHGNGSVKPGASLSPTVPEIAFPANPQRVNSITNRNMVLSPEQLPSTPLPVAVEGKMWNRWLILIQTFTAPFFVVLVVWANTDIENPHALLRPTLYSLLFSLVVLAILLTTTTPTRPPAWRPLLCFMGFAVSIAWISTIANEVVGVLKTLGVILNMSDAILGLTIFAVGNSLGDFVADITVARLGYPVMALSACFGGPMLNILMGIGISGCYLTIKGGNKHHKKHPDRPVHFKPYHLDISTTLVISGFTLLLTLVGLLVAVPARGWKMDKMIGWGLVAVWGASTITNVVVEVVGTGSHSS